MLPARGRYHAQELLLRDVYPAMLEIKLQGRRAVEEGYDLDQALRIELAILEGSGAAQDALETRKRAMTTARVLETARLVQETVQTLLEDPSRFGLELMEETEE